MIKAVCFDFDGTLAQFSGDFQGFVDRFGRELELSQEEMGTLEQQRAQLERRDGAMTFYSTVRAAFDALELPHPDNLEHIARDAVAYYCTQMLLLPGALDVLTLCQQHALPCALLTNGTADMQRAAVQAVGIEGYFKRILVSGDADVAVRKPHPYIFQLACEALTTAPGETLMVGDNLEADVRGARAYGMQAVYVGREPGTGHAGVTAIKAFRTWLEAQL